MSMKLFNNDGNIILRHVSDSNLIDHVPPAVYRLRENPRKGEIYLVKDREKFSTPAKFYGMHNRNKAAILAAYKKCDGATGVLLRGIKGAGKSVLAEDLGNSLLQLDIPVIMVDEEVSRAALDCATHMAGPCMVYFDEFGKTFGAEARRDLLTYFSDSSFKQVLFVVTSNSKKELDKYMLDRPGRFLFRIDYKSLDPVAIAEMIDDHGLTPEMSVMMNAYVSQREVTFDMLRFLAPIAAECGDPYEFNERISILNCPSPVYPHLTFRKALFQGQEFHGYIKAKVVGDRHYTFELIAEGQVEAVAKGEFNWKGLGRVQVMHETTLSRDVQFFVDDVVLIGIESYVSNPQTTISAEFFSKEFQEKQVENRSNLHRSGMEVLIERHMPEFFRSSPAAPSLTADQQKLLDMAKYIVDNHGDKAPVEEAAATVEPAN